MKPAFCFLIVTLLINLPIDAQIPLHTIFPMGVIGYTEGEALLFKKEIFSRQGIKKIFAYQTSPQITTAFVSKSVYLNRNGNADSIIIHFRHDKSDSGFYSTDRYLYDQSGRLIESISYQGKSTTSKIFRKTFFEYTGENEVIKSTTLELDGSDTLTTDKYYNKKGQFVQRDQFSTKSGTTNASLYYDTEGMLDSITYDHPTLPTNIFKTTRKKNLKIIKSENEVVWFKWTYNSSGQCISTVIISKKKTIGASYKRGSKSETRYYYNPDGTLSKATTKSRGKPDHSMIYTFSK